ncbi:serine protease FAM111A-like isoform X2 [Rhinoderma darwinii]|uniref:serine protease FAM111A-like isoform X2 n=1 Tax=Rhinoderma darwinii TaxID=43563 RepID=UPI003F67BE9D
MADRSSNDNTQDHESSYLLDKENQSNSLEQNQIKRPSMMIQHPLKENQLCNLTTNSEMGKNKNTEESKREESGPLGENQIISKSRGIRKTLTTPRGAKSAGKGHHLNLRKNTDEDLLSPGVEETPNQQESTESKEEKVNIESMMTEEKRCVSYKWNKESITSNTTGFNTPVIDFAKQNNPLRTGYLFVYARELKAVINPWVPCGALGEKEILEFSIRKGKSSNSSNGECKQGVEIMAPDMYKYPSFCDSYFFKVKYQGRTKGGQSVKIIQKSQFYSADNPIAVFGYLGETINQALQNDKRFIIPGQFILEDSHCNKMKSDVLLSMLTPDTYTIVMVDKRPKSGNMSPKKTLKKEDLQNNEGSTTSIPGTSVPRSEPCVGAPDQPVFVSSPLSFKFSREIQKLAKDIGAQNLESELVNSYKRNVVYKEPMMATTLRLLTKHLDNVALLKYNIGDTIKSGTLFLLTENLGITCYHVVKLLIKSRAVTNVEVRFKYESEENIFSGEYKRVVWANKKLDCAFVQIKISQSYPGLLKHITPPPQGGALSIIGHPNSNHKKIDLNCSVVAFSQRADSIADTILSNRSYVHVLTQHNFSRMNDQTLTTYDSCLYWGASGAPVFNEHGDLVAMHLGGYPANTPLKKKSVIEYGRSAVDIIIHGAIHLKEIRDPFKKLVEEKENLSRYLQAGGHPVTMQPAVRRLLNLWGKSDSQIEQDRKVDESDTADSMDTS